MQLFEQEQLLVVGEIPLMKSLALAGSPFVFWPFILTSPSSSSTTLPLLRFSRSCEVEYISELFSLERLPLTHGEHQ
jgi:hypothetical protein